MLKRYLLLENPEWVGAEKITMRTIDGVAIYSAMIDELAAKLFIPSNIFADNHIRILYLCLVGLHERLIPEKYLETTDPFLAQMLMTNPKISEKTKTRIRPVMLTNLRHSMEYSHNTGERLPEIEDVLTKYPSLFIWYISYLMDIDEDLVDLLSSNPETAYEYAMKVGYSEEQVHTTLLNHPIYGWSYKLMLGK